MERLPRMLRLPRSHAPGRLVSGLLCRLLSKRPDLRQLCAAAARSRLSASRASAGIVLAALMAPEDRAAACLVLLYAQPLSKIVALTTDDLTAGDDGTYLRLGPEPLLLPPRWTRS